MTQSKWLLLRVETVAGNETITDCGTRHRQPCPKHRQITRQGYRHSTRLKLSRCRASCGIHILRQQYCTRLKLRHGLSARIRKCTRLRNGSTAAQRLYNTRQGRTARLLDTLYRHSSPAARQHGAAVQKYHIYQRQHIATSTRQQTRSSITVHRQANDRQRHRHSSTAAQQSSAKPTTASATGSATQQPAAKPTTASATGSATQQPRAKPTTASATDTAAQQSSAKPTTDSATTQQHSTGLTTPYPEKNRDSEAPRPG